VTGRSRLSLCASRIPAGLIYLLPFVTAAYAHEAGASVVFTGWHPAPSAHLLVVTGLWALLTTTFYYLLALGVCCVVGPRATRSWIVLAWRLALTPLLASIAALGVVRDLIPGVALDNQLPAAPHDAAPRVGMSVAAIAVVLVAASSFGTLGREHRRAIGVTIALLVALPLFFRRDYPWAVLAVRLGRARSRFSLRRCGPMPAGATHT
jgi:hypothetical protein